MPKRTATISSSPICACPTSRAPSSTARSVERYADNPPRFIFMSANTGIEEYAAFLAETGEPALEKPFNLADMRQVVMQVLAQKPRA